MNQNYYSPAYLSYLEARQQAEEVVKAKIGFYWHLIVYLVINVFLIFIYLYTSWSHGALYYPWVMWPLVSWGVALIFHYLAVYVFQDNIPRRQQLIDLELKRMGVRRNPEWPLYPPPMDKNTSGAESYDPFGSH